MSIQVENGKIVGYDEQGNKVPLPAEAIAADQIDNSSQDPDRPLFLTSPKTVTVDPGGGEDYTSAQDAVDNEAPYFVGINQLTIYLNDGTYNEDVTVEGVHGDRGIGNDAIVFVGDTTTPSNVDGLSFAVKNCTGRIQVTGVTLDREHPFESENSGFIAYHSIESKVDACDIGNITVGVVSYGSLNVEVAEVDFGSNLQVAEKVKHGGTIQEQGTNASNITGTASTVYQVSSGTIYEAQGNSLSASTDRYELFSGEVIDRSGLPRGEMDVPDGSTAVGRHFVFGGDTKRFAGRNVQRTEGVSTSATTILSLQNEEGDAGRSGVVAVEGYDTSNNNTFLDLVMMTRAGTPTTVNSAESGTPATRTYGISASDLTLEMGSDTYDINAKADVLRSG